MNPQQPIIPPSMNPAPAPMSAPQSPQPVKKDKAQKVILGIIIVAIIAAGAYYFIKKRNADVANSTGTNTPVIPGDEIAKKPKPVDVPRIATTSPSGLFTYSYPQLWKMSTSSLYTSQGAIVLDGRNKNERVMMFEDLNNDVLSILLKQVAFTKGPSSTVDGYPMDTYTYGVTNNGQTIYLTVQVITVVIPQLGSIDLILSISGADSTTGTDIARTIKFNKDKIATVSTSISSALAEARKRGEDASIKANLANIRADASLYYEKASSYIGLCKSANIKSLLSAVASSTSMSSVVCKDSKPAFAVSAKLLTQGYFCVDGTGFSAATKAPITGTACVK
jgi:hypothetical protein